MLGRDSKGQEYIWLFFLICPKNKQKIKINRHQSFNRVIKFEVDKPCKCSSRNWPTRYKLYGLCFRNTATMEWISVTHHHLWMKMRVFESNNSCVHHSLNPKAPKFVAWFFVLKTTQHWCDPIMSTSVNQLKWISPPSSLPFSPLLTITIKNSLVQILIVFPILFWHPVYLLNCFIFSW